MNYWIKRVFPTTGTLLPNIQNDICLQAPLKCPKKQKKKLCLQKCLVFRPFFIRSQRNNYAKRATMRKESQKFFFYVFFLRNYALCKLESLSDICPKVSNSQCNEATCKKLNEKKAATKSRVVNSNLIRRCAISSPTLKICVTAKWHK